MLMVDFGAKKHLRFGLFIVYTCLGAGSTKI